MKATLYECSPNVVHTKWALTIRRSSNCEYSLSEDFKLRVLTIWSLLIVSTLNSRTLQSWALPKWSLPIVSNLTFNIEKQAWDIQKLGPNHQCWWKHPFLMQPYQTSMFTIDIGYRRTLYGQEINWRQIWEKGNTLGKLSIN